MEKSNGRGIGVDTKESSLGLGWSAFKLKIYWEQMGSKNKMKGRWIHWNYKIRLVAKEYTQQEGI